MTSPGRGMQPDGALKATVTGLLAAAELRAGELVAERYRIVRLLGMGGMGVVYQARDLELDIDVALKLLRPELASRPDAFDRFRQELLLARQVSSPHVVRIHDIAVDAGRWFISMDFVDGEGSLAPERAIGIVRQLALGLSAAHHRGVVHRDLKPANVLINEHGDAAITDFGVARSAGSTGITGSGVVIGTPEYLSPEQARAEPLDGRSDLYALGLILFEMLTGTLPFRGGTPAEMLAQRIVRDPPSVDSVKPGLPTFAVRLCARLLELKPARRFQSADDVVRAIDRRRVPGIDNRQRKVLRFSAALAIAAALLVGGGYWNSTRPMPGSSAPTAAASPLDLAPLPFTASSEGDAALAHGIGLRLADALAGTPALHSAGPTRVARALTELGFDAAAAQRHRARVAQALGARTLLQGEVVRDATGIEVRVTSWPADGGSAAWSESRHAATPAELPARLLELEQVLRARFGLPPDARAWPGSGTLAALGSIGSSAAADASLDAALRLAPDANEPLLWWQVLESLDRTGRQADAAAAARKATDALADRTDFASRRVLAIAGVLLGDDAAAITRLTQMHAELPDDPATILWLARAHADTGQFDEAQALLVDLVAADARNVDAWYALGKYAIQAGDAKRAVDDYLVRAQVLANRLDEPRMRADVSNALGIGYRRLGQLTLAAEQLQHAARLRGALADARGQAASLRNLATVRSIQGDFDAAQAALDEARHIIEPLGDSAALADLANDAGLLQEERGDYRKALESYRRALNLRQSLHDPQRVAESLINVGFAYYQIGEFDNAQLYSEQAATTYATVDDKTGGVHAQQNLGLIEVARGDWVRARALQAESLRTAEGLQMAEEATISRAALAELDRLEGALDAAIAEASAALAEFGGREDPRGTTEMKLLLSATYCDAGDWDAAAEALDALVPAQVANGEQASLLAWRRGEIALGR
ncbi:MAG TPA: serine/threonine-protein kinase, partial [Dokdonella sp.]